MLGSNEVVMQNFSITVNCMAVSVLNMPIELSFIWHLSFVKAIMRKDLMFSLEHFMSLGFYNILIWLYYSQLLRTLNILINAGYYPLIFGLVAKYS